MALMLRNHETDMACLRVARVRQLTLGTLGFIYIAMLICILPRKRSLAILNSRVPDSDDVVISDRSDVTLSRTATGNDARGVVSSGRPARKISEFISDEDYSINEDLRTTCNYCRINQPYICATNVDTSAVPFILVQIHSSCDNKPSRNSVRETWGQVVKDYNADTRIALVFLIGTCSRQEDNEHISREAALYRDIVQFDFTDRYANLTLKSLLGLQWAQTFCSNVSYILKSDDDTYLHLASLIHLLLDEPRHTSHIIGHVYPHANVVRQGLWAVKPDMFAADKYPPYCSGSAYVLGWRIVPRLLETHRQRTWPLLTIEDVYITGILAEHSSVGRTHMHVFPRWDTGPSLTSVQRLLNRDLFAIHWVPYEVMYKIHDLLNKCLDCAYNATSLRHWYGRMRERNSLQLSL